MKKVYISGAIAGLDLAERKAAFKAAERELAEMGFAPREPLRQRRARRSPLARTHAGRHRPAGAVRPDLHAAGLGTQQGREAGARRRHFVRHQSFKVRIKNKDYELYRQYKTIK